MWKARGYGAIINLLGVGEGIFHQFIRRNKQEREG
jgi:hypothetical protein